MPSATTPQSVARHQIKSLLKQYDTASSAELRGQIAQQLVVPVQQFFYHMATSFKDGRLCTGLEGNCLITGKPIKGIGVWLSGDGYGAIYDLEVVTTDVLDRVPDSQLEKHGFDPADLRDRVARLSIGERLSIAVKR